MPRKIFVKVQWEFPTAGSLVFWKPYPWVSAFRSFASQTLDKEGRTGLDCPVKWSLLVLPPALVELEGVSLLVELEDRSALALLKDGSFKRTICAVRSISWIAFRATCAIWVRTDSFSVRAFIEIQVKVTQCIMEPEIKLTVAKNNSWRITKNKDSTKKIIPKGCKK